MLVHDHGVLEVLHGAVDVRQGRLDLFHGHQVAATQDRNAAGTPQVRAVDRVSYYYGTRIGPGLPQLATIVARLQRFSMGPGGFEPPTNGL